MSDTTTTRAADDTRTSRQRQLDALAEGRRNARFHHAQRRVRAIVDAMPPLTDDQLAALAVLLHPAE